MSLKTRNHITFEESKHRYTNTKTGEIYTSGTGFIGKFHPKFDSLKIATDLVNNNPKYKDTTVDALLAEWDKSAKVGTLIHNYLEKHLLGTLQESLAKADAITTLRVKHLTDAWDGLCLKDIYKDWEIVPEMLLYLDEYKLAGQSDLVLLNHEKKKFKILDYKTNKKGVAKEAFNGATMFPPVNHLADCKFMHYALQLSLYGYMLEKELGYECDGNEILWVDTNDSKQIGIYQWECPYYKKEIEEMLRKFTVGKKFLDKT